MSVVGSRSPPSGFAFLEKSGQAFAEIRGRANTGIFGDGALHVGINSRRGGVSKKLLRAHEARGAGGEEIIGDFARSGEKPVRGNDFGDDAHDFGFGSLDNSAGEKQVAGGLVSKL